MERDPGNYPGNNSYGVGLMGRLDKTEARLRRKKRIRKKVKGTLERPRLCVYRALKHIYAQVVDDENNMVLAQASTLSRGLRERLGKVHGNQKEAREVGLEIARRLKEKGIEKVVFDRNGYKYHGRVKALAEGAREGGLLF